MGKSNRKPSDRVEYWDPLAQLIMETINARHRQKLSQSSLAKRMKTKQSVISRFENMGRLPSYDFISRLALSLGHRPGMTLNGEMMYVVPEALRESLAKRALQTRVSVQDLVTRLIRAGMALLVTPMQPGLVDIVRLGTLADSATQPDSVSRAGSSWTSSSGTKQHASIAFNSANSSPDRGAA